MIRYIYCIRKKQDISPEEFRTYWNSTEYKELLKRVASYYQAVRYSQNLALKVEMGEMLISKNGLSEPYDATIELFWENANNLTALYDNEEAQVLAKQLQGFQSEFIDASHSTVFFTMEQNGT